MVKKVMVLLFYFAGDPDPLERVNGLIWAGESVSNYKQFQGWCLKIRTREHKNISGTDENLSFIYSFAVHSCQNNWTSPTNYMFVFSIKGVSLIVSSPSFTLKFSFEFNLINCFFLL